MKTCQQCGIEFEVRNWGNPNRFCTKACLYESMRKPPLRLICELCGKEFSRPAYATRGHGRKGKYCSQDCSGAAAGKWLSATRQSSHRLKACAACGTEFEIGGRGKPDKDVRYCSTPCRRSARYRHGNHVAQLSPTDAAYLAGFWDGEGSIILVWRGDHVGLTASVVNTDKGVMDWIAQVTGMSVVHCRKIRSDKHRQAFGWAIHAEAAESLIRQLRPYLRVKAAQADLAIETQERLRTPSIKADRSWHEDWRQRMRTLNQRGPIPIVASGL